MGTVKFMSIRTFQNNQDALLTANFHRAMFNKLGLSEQQQTLVAKYHRILVQAELSDEDLSQLSGIWENAETDEALTEALCLIDELHVNCLDCEQLLSEDHALRTYLSESVAIMAAEDYRISQDQRHEGQEMHVLMLCPDGSGTAALNIPNGDFVRQNGDHICDRCKKRISDHETFFYFKNRELAHLASQSQTQSQGMETLLLSCFEGSHICFEGSHI
jgi:hypothetical protein